MIKLFRLCAQSHLLLCRDDAAGFVLVDALIAARQRLRQWTVRRCFFDAARPVPELRTGIARIIRIRRIAVFCVIALLQQKKPAAQFALPNQMSGFQSFIKIQLQKRLQMLCFVVFKNPELPRIRCCFPRHEMDSDIIKERIIAAAFYRIGDPFVPEFRKEKSVQGRNILIRRQMFKSGKRLPNKRTKRLTDGGNIFKHLRIIHTICFIHLPLQIQRHRRDQQRRRFRLRLWRNGRIQVQIPFPLLLAQFLRILDSAVFLRIFQVVFICTDLT